jgi:hypothetical protein
MRTRQHRIEFYLNDREINKFNRAVEKSGLNRSTYLRHLVHGFIPQDRPPKDYFDLLSEMRAIGRNINQIAYIANATGIIEAERFDDRYSELLRLILKIIDTAEMPKDMM